MFKVAGVLVAIYAAYASVRGEVYAKSGPGARVVSRQDSPRYFWTVIAIYGALGVALRTVF